MRRRDFFWLVSGAYAWPFAALAQQPERVRRIGVLMAYAESDPEAKARVAALQKELHKLGWTEGRNIQIDARWPAADLEKINRIAQELVASRPDVILSSTTLTTEALLRRTRTIPIIFATVADPVGSGFVATMSRPGGNVTGFTSIIEGAMAGKWLELLKQVAPRLRRVALLYNLTTAPYSEIYLVPFMTAAVALGVEAILIFAPGPFMATRSAQITALAAHYRLPAIYPFRYYSELGGLLSYGNDQHDNYRRAGAYVDRILRGAKVGELPVQNPVNFELTINLKTAKALGLSVPPFLLAQADHVIE
jgi:putative ABC transport system substrate-binding protein